MILDPINDIQCMAQLTRIARELVPTTLIQSAARRLGSSEAIVRWFQSLPQADDFGEEEIRRIDCDVPQRVRLLPDNPNCVERATAALMLLEVVDAATPRALATVDRPLRHTGLVEQVGARWRAVDLFPRRNARRNLDWGNLGKDILQGAHSYVGKPLLKFYLGDTGGKVADAIGDQENQWIGRKKTTEKKAEPPLVAKEQKQRKPDAPKPAQSGVSVAALSVGPGASKNPDGRGGNEHAENEESQRRPGAPAGNRAAVRVAEGAAADRNDRDIHHAKEKPQRWWWFLG